MSDPVVDRRRSLALVAVAYACGLAAAVIVLRGAGGGADRWAGPIEAALAADIAATLVVFAFSVLADNASVYDPYWSLAPPLLGVWWASLDVPAASPPAARRTIVLALVVAWGLRLTWNWLRRWNGSGDEDWRYREIRSRAGRLWWPASLGGIHLLPTVLVFAGCLSLFDAVAGGSRPLGPLDALAAVAMLTGIALETVADRQLRVWLDGPRTDPFLRTGLWSRSRHPNYLGELLFWWGLAGFGLAAGGGRWWRDLVGAAAITLLFLAYSLPAMERRMQTKAGYGEHARRTPLLLPCPTGFRPWRSPSGSTDFRRGR